MSRRTYLDEDGEIEKEVIESEDECRYKVNGKCYNNWNMKALGKRCFKKCTHFLMEEGNDR